MRNLASHLKFIFKLLNKTIVLIGFANDVFKREKLVVPRIADDVNQAACPLADQVDYVEIEQLSREPRI